MPSCSREPDRRELAERTGIDRAQVEALLTADAPPRRLDEPLTGAEGELGTLGELLADPLSADAYEQVLDGPPERSCARCSVG